MTNPMETACINISKTKADVINYRYQKHFIDTDILDSQ